MIQLNITEPMVVRASGQESTAPTEFEMPSGDILNLPANTLVFDPDEYTGDWIPNVSLEIDSENKKAASKRDNLQEYQILIQDPTNNLEEIKKIYLPKISGLTAEEVERIITPVAPEPGMVDPMADPNAAIEGEIVPPMPTGVPV